ncbi:ABC transporter permease [Hoyosella rhizosphaerae]|uniref:Transport permease protein n=1 Tax=Hoyosella rhizosphaerae TaxID=1755582 RepID=A0A916XJT6_9ACTN|nr:ABC transporter permease [Hoyosella rhizosphaerae]MBN4925241.1 ABC transporter permease [Hoyosella rhizosphaerae]GGC77294.1 transport permease protein [Hoyosella rhizosphaerae]
MSTATPQTTPRKSPAVLFPELTHTRKESSLVALPRQSLLMAKRSLLIWSRDPLTMVQAVAYPAIMLLMLRLVMGDTIERFSGQPAVFRFAPLMALVAAMVGALAGVVLVIQEREKGILGRYWTLPIHRAADLIGRLLAESVRIVFTTLLIILVALPLGLTFTSVSSFFAFVAIPLMFGIGFATLATAAALATTSQALVSALSLFIMFGMFFSSGFTDPQAFPAWARPFVENQPITHAVDTMRALATGGDVATPLMMSALWSVGFVVVFAVPAIWGYRRSASS